MTVLSILRCGVRLSILPLILVIQGNDLLHAQQISSQFTFTLETLPRQQREDMRDFNRDLQNYVEGWDWMDEDLPDPVQLYMEGPLAYRGSVTKTQYASKLTISNGLDAKYLDRWWFFEFERGDQLQHDERRFHPLTWMIDFYVHIMVGHELDKYSEYGGEIHFERARTISTDGRFDQNYQRGWDERMALVEGILSDDYKPYRRIRRLYHQALTDQKNNNAPEAKEWSRQAIDILGAQYRLNQRDDHVRSFMSAHYIELADIFKTETTPEIYHELIAIDPDHKSTYEEYIADIGRRP